MSIFCCCITFSSSVICAPQDFSKKEREDIDFAIQDGIGIIRAVLSLGMEKALSGVRVK